MAGDEWEWDETLFAGSAPYYWRGREPYPRDLSDRFATSVDLTGSPRLLDVGCGPGTITLALAPLVAEAVGVDPDAEMLAEANAHARTRGIDNVKWIRSRAEDLTDSLGTFRFATFAQSFHWMERERVAALMYSMIEPGGAFVHVSPARDDIPPAPPGPHPTVPGAAIRGLRRRYLGPDRRAGQGIRNRNPSGEEHILRAAGFTGPRVVRVTGRELLRRTIDDVVAAVYSNSSTAPHLFGDRREEWEADLRRLLRAASPSGRFSERTGDTELIFWTRPPD